VSGRSPVVAWREVLLASGVGWRARYIGLVLSTHMDRDGGSCFPSLTRLQRETRLGRTTVCAGLRELELAGLLERARGGRGRPTRYRATSSPGELALVRHANATSSPREPEDAQESAHNFSGRAHARRKKTGARAAGAHPDLNYLDEDAG
jgi:hypothetical protein